jgi:hypothetical protein
VSRTGTKRHNPAGLRAVQPGPLQDGEVHAGQLGALDEERLCRLLELRPDLGVPAPASLAEMEERSLSLSSVYDALMRADVLVLQLAQILTIIGQKHAGLTDVLAMVGDVPEADVERGLSWLEERNLISRIPGSDVCVHSGLLSIGGAGALGPPAADLVKNLSAAQLSFILRTIGRTTGETRKTALANELTALLKDQDAVRNTVGGAPDEVQKYARAAASGSTSIRLPARDTNEQEFALRRQRFLAEQGYAYRIVDSDEVLVGNLPG